MTTPTVQPSYGSVTTITCGLATGPLASSATLVAGREATAPTVNSTSLFDDVFLSGQVTVGTTPTSGTNILIYVFGALDKTPTWPDVMTGSDSNETITSVGVGVAYLNLVKTLVVDSTTSNRKYPFGPISLAQFFGGNMPDYWNVWVVHNTGVALNSTGGNHFIEYYGVNYIIPSI